MDFTHKLEGVEIFAAGKHNGDTYTVSDLDAMVDAFYKLDFKPPLKAGHVEDKQGMPALGWISNLRRTGEKLLADFIEMPQGVYDYIKGKRYNTVSSEVFWNLRRGDKFFSRALKAVSLLGAEIPAVAGLKSLNEMFSADAEVHVHQWSPTGDQNTTTKEHPMDVKELQGKLAAAEKALSEQSARADAAEKAAKDVADKVAKLEEAYKAKGNDGLDKALASLNASEQEEQVKSLALAKEAAEKSAKAEREAREALEKSYSATNKRLAELEEEVRKQKVGELAERCRIPAMRPYVQAFVDLASRDPGAKVYSEKQKGEADAMQVATELVEFINGTSKHLFSVVSKDTNDQKQRDADASAEVSKRAKAYALQHKVDPFEAMKAVLADDPLLAQEYRDQMQRSA